MSEGIFRATRNSRKKASSKERTIEKQQPSIESLAHYANRTNGFSLKLLTKKCSLNRKIKYNEINRPGLNLVGFYKHFAHSRIQVFGRGEHAYLMQLHKNNDLRFVEKLFSYAIPVIIFSHGNTPPKAFLDMAEKSGVPVFYSALPTSELIESLYDFFDDSFFYKKIINGVMLEIFGLGVFIEGEKQIGKSEAALELIERGHRFIADDVVEVCLLRKNKILAKSTSLVSTHTEITGVGVVNVAYLFGVRSILKSKNIDICISLVNAERESQSKIAQMQREKYRMIFDVRIPRVCIPVRSSSNTPILIETAVMNHSLKSMGYDAAEQFSKRVLKATDKPYFT